MSDTTLNRFVGQGTMAERLAFVPDPATPVSGPLPGYFFFETDTGDTYAWDIVAGSWVLLIASSPGTVTAVSVASANGFAGSVANPTTTPAITLSTSITGILKGNGTAVAAAIAADFPTLNQNTTGSAATLTTPRNINGVAFNGSADITVTAAAGTLTGTTLASAVVTSSLTALGTIATGVWQGTAVGPVYGGTGLTSYTTGDLLYASASNVLSKLAATTNGFVLTLAAGVPAWAAATGGTVTVSGTPTNGQIAEWTSATNLQGLTATGTGNAVRATSPTLVTPALGTPTALVLTNATGLPVAGGGTGAASFTAYAVLCGGTTSTGALQSIAALGTSGWVLTSNGAGALPTFQAAGGGGSGTVNSGAANRLAFYATAGTAVSGADGTAQVIIGTASSSIATGTFAIYGDAAATASFAARVAEAGAGTGGQTYYSKCRGTIASPTAVQNGDTLGRIMFGGYANAWAEVYAGISANATETWTSTGTLGTNLVFMVTRAGTNTRDDALTLKTSSTTQTLTALAGMTLATASNGDLQLLPNGSGVVLVQNSGASSLAIDSTSSAPAVRFRIATTQKAVVTVASTANNGITGSVTDDFCISSNASKACLISTDAGNTIGFQVVANNGGIKTSTPSGGTSGAWKLGSRVAATVVLDTSQYVQLDVGGTLYKLAIAA